MYFIDLSKEYRISTKEEKIEYEQDGPKMASITLPNVVSTNSSHTNITYIYDKLKKKNQILSLENQELKKGMARIDSILKNTGGILLDLKKEQAFPYLKIVPLAMWGILFLCLFGPKFQKIVKVCFNFGKSEDKVVDQLIP